uniref:Secreted protein n=1 Tax=Setaria viridis TaxID=4556 RepID=A0A4U6TWZ0_SETVI|nr:hypothetical protein SEVIR_7G303800v2 [Setaria viridis]
MTTCSLLVAAVVVCVVVSPAAAGPYLCTWRTNGTPLRFDKVESAKAQGVGQCVAVVGLAGPFSIAALKHLTRGLLRIQIRPLVAVAVLTQLRLQIHRLHIPPPRRLGFLPRHRREG